MRTVYQKILTVAILIFSVTRNFRSTRINVGAFVITFVPKIITILMRGTPRGRGRGRGDGFIGYRAASLLSVRFNS